MPSTNHRAGQYAFKHFATHCALSPLLAFAMDKGFKFCMFFLSLIFFPVPSPLVSIEGHIWRKAHK